MKTILSLAIIATLMSCSNKQLPMFQNIPVQSAIDSTITNEQVVKALKEVLTNGVHKQVTEIGNYNGFYNNPKIKFGLPENLSNVEKALVTIKAEKLTAEGIKLLNHTAEDVAKQAKPIVLEAIKNLQIQNPTLILTGDSNAATEYLKANTTDDLVIKLTPIVEKSFETVGADKYWDKIIRQYNSLDFIKDKINPDFTEYISKQTINGILTSIAVEEAEIRKNKDARNTELVREVFASQNNK